MGQDMDGQQAVEVVEVVAAVIERKGLILICQRKNRGKHALKWEFPGGKVEAGESAAAALKRELKEELGIHAEIGNEIGRYDFQYGGAPVTRLTFFRVTQFSGEIENLDFEQIRWEERSKLPDYDFLEGDIEFVRYLAAIEQ